MSQEPRQPSDLSARRRLLRGAFAVPAVMTVVSGRALAQTSASTCIQKQIEPSASELVSSTYTAEPGELVRVRLHAVKKKGTGEIASYWLHGASLPAGSSGVLGSSQVQQFDIGPAKKLVGPTHNTQPPMQSNQRFVPSDKYVALRFNKDGDVVGVGMGTTTDSWTCSYSCWNSFNGIT